MLICLDPDQKGPLGIHVLPYCDDGEQCEGLLIKDVERGGRIDRDGRFTVGDRIIEVNDTDLLTVPFEQAQQIIAQALASGDLRLKVVKNSKRHHMHSASINSVDSLPTRTPLQSTTVSLN